MTTGETPSMDRDPDHAEDLPPEERHAAAAAEIPTMPAISTDEAKRAIEAMVLVATDPLAEHLLAQLIEIPLTLVRELCHELAASYAKERRGFQLVEVANGWRFQTHPDLSPYIERYVLEGQTTRLSTAALETLAIVAYKQPISRAQVSAIRGVNVDGVLRTLVHRGYLGEVGRDDGPGQAVLFGTTSAFLEKLGIASIEQLPPLGDFVPGAHVVEALEQTLRVDRSASPANEPNPQVDVEGSASGVFPVEAPVGDQIDPLEQQVTLNPRVGIESSGGVADDV